MQVHQIPVTVVDPHLYRKESLIALKQPFRNVFQIRNECKRLTNIKTIRVIPTDARVIFWPLVSLKSMSIQWKKIFEQRSELKVAKWLIVHVLSSGYNVSRRELRNKKEATQLWSLRVSKDIALNQVCVYHERVYAYNVVSKFWLVRCLSSQHYSQFITNITYGNVSHIRTEKLKTRSFICKVNLNFLWSSRHFNYDTIFIVIVSFLNESVHGLNSIRNGRVKARFQIVEFWRLKFLVKKHKFSFRDILVNWWGGYFWNCNLPLTFQIQLLWWKLCKIADCIVWKQLCGCIWNQVLVNASIVKWFWSTLFDKIYRG